MSRSFQISFLLPHPRFTIFHPAVYIHQIIVKALFLPKYAKFSTTLTMPTLRNKHNAAFKSISILRKEDICLEQFMNGTWYNMHNTYTMHIFYSNLSLLSQKKNLSAKRAGMVTSFFLQFMIVLAEYTFRKIETRHFYRFFVSR